MIEDKEWRITVWNDTSKQNVGLKAQYTAYTVDEAKAIYDNAVELYDHVVLELVRHLTIKVLEKGN